MRSRVGKGHACATCQSGRRAEIDQLIRDGLSACKIEALLAPMARATTSFAGIRSAVSVMGSGN